MIKLIRTWIFVNSFNNQVVGNVEVQVGNSKGVLEIPLSSETAMEISKLAMNDANLAWENMRGQG